MHLSRVALTSILSSVRATAQALSCIQSPLKVLSRITHHRTLPLGETDHALSCVEFPPSGSYHMSSNITFGGNSSCFILRPVFTLKVLPHVIEHYLRGKQLTPYPVSSFHPQDLITCPFSLIVAYFIKIMLV